MDNGKPTEALSRTLTRLRIIIQLRERKQKLLLHLNDDLFERIVAICGDTEFFEGELVVYLRDLVEATGYDRPEIIAELRKRGIEIQRDWEGASFVDIDDVFDVDAEND